MCICDINMISTLAPQYSSLIRNLAQRDFADGTNFIKLIKLEYVLSCAVLQVSHTLLSTLEV